MTVSSPSRFVRYLTVFLRWLLVGFGFFALTVLAGSFVINNVLAKVYTATAQIELRQENYGPGGINGPYARPAGLDQQTFEAECSILESPDFLLPIISDLSLDKAWAKRIFKTEDDQLPASDALAHLQTLLKIDFVQGTNIINITASSDEPQEAADIANAIATQYKTLRDVEEDQRNSKGEDLLRDQIAEQQKVVNDAKVNVEKMRQQLGSQGIDIKRSAQETEQLLKPFRDAQQDLANQQNLLDALNVRLKQVEADRSLVQPPVSIVSHAVTPTAPTHPNKKFDFMLTIIAGVIVGILAASFSEVIFLLTRAAERGDN
jgi:uncharacterized protein involved in exopolysaccharide biosynthesis